MNAATADEDSRKVVEKIKADLERFPLETWEITQFEAHRRGDQDPYIESVFTLKHPELHYTVDITYTDYDHYGNELYVSTVNAILIETDRLELHKIFRQRKMEPTPAQKQRALNRFLGV